MALPPLSAPQLVADRIDAYAALPASHPGRLDSETADRLRAWLPTVERWARQLDDTGLPLTLDHNDLHANNAFALLPGDQRLQFFDFGDALLGHPLCSLMIPVRVLARNLDADPQDPRVQRVIDAYLECWTDLVDRATLRAAIEPAMQFGGLHRAESWHRVLPSAKAAELKEFGDAPTWWLTNLLSDPPRS